LSRARFYGACLRLAPVLEETAVAAFWEAGCLGVEVESSALRRSQPRVTLRAYFPGLPARARLQGRVARALSAAGIAPPPLRVVPARRWVEIWQRSLRPMPVGRSFLVVPQGCRGVPARGRRVIRVRFGQAFGTGEHASTRMSLRLLETHLAAGDRVVDLGTGTGILAMAACRLGAARVLAVDKDPVALAVARANLADNRLSRRVALRRIDAKHACRLGPFDLALVNIGATVIDRLLPDLAGALQPGGRAVLAGILVEDEPGLIAGGLACGLRLVARRRSRPWSALVLRRGGP
jgi:ribosomal protein L11 methyltransferase